MPPSTFLALPPELHARIVDLVGIPDIAALSLTCRELRKHVYPFPLVLTTVRAHTNEYGLWTVLSERPRLAANVRSLTLGNVGRDRVLKIAEHMDGDEPNEEDDAGPREESDRSNEDNEEQEEQEEEGNEEGQEESGEEDEENPIMIALAAAVTNMRNLEHLQLTTFEYDDECESLPNDIVWKAFELCPRLTSVTIADRDYYDEVSSEGQAGIIVTNVHLVPFLLVVWV
jgi:hypothetical protein